MKTVLAGVFIATISVLSSGGCRLCCDREDAAYAAYGGAWQRLQRDSGRVGSLADPAGAKVGTLKDREIDLGEEASRSQILPPNEDRPSMPSKEDIPENFVPKFEEETDEEFQERLRKFQEEQLNAKVIPGAPAPPAFR
ncbi:hypothetical protein LOC67_13565 [Stieleria sp. JC731]|uniref:hypothetical protein n=1 Tax=Pirellulaceae TaxID=2691357 RepID=UPI001E4BE5F4|nr:hypothetical protein [Stieleria sp. JC731]MCC9601580.1 hypothetical protein [Stieleria sp. JC731]